MSNIAEGLERGTTKELIYFLFIAKGSVGEVRAQLYVAEDQGYVDGDNARTMRETAKNISIQLSNWTKSMQTPDSSTGPMHNTYKGSEEIKQDQSRNWLEKHVEEINRKRKEE